MAGSSERCREVREYWPKLHKLRDLRRLIAPLTLTAMNISQRTEGGQVHPRSVGPPVGELLLTREEHERVLRSPARELPQAVFEEAATCLARAVG